MHPVELLETLLRHYSPSRQEEEASAFFFQSLDSLGFCCQIDSVGNVIGQRGHGPRELMLLGHIDTVPGFIPVEQRSGRLYGRGAVDAKGPLACFAASAARVNIPDGWRLSVIAAVGEEDDSRGARYLADSYPGPPEMVIVGEPSGWERITLGYKGSASVRFSLQAEMAHRAGNARTASEGAVQFWNDLRTYAGRYNRTKKRLFEQLLPVLTAMNTENDGFKETARLDINLRLPIGVDERDLVEMLGGISVDGDVTVHDFTPAYLSGKNNRLVRAFLQAVRAQGGRPGFSLKTGTADMNRVAPQWGCPAVAYGPGDSSLDHTPQEHILIEEYLLAIEVLEKAILKAME